MQQQVGDSLRDTQSRIAYMSRGASTAVLLFVSVPVYFFKIIAVPVPFFQDFVQYQYFWLIREICYDLQSN